MLLFDVWKGSELAFGHLRQLFLGKVLFSVCMYGDIEIWLREHFDKWPKPADLNDSEGTNAPLSPTEDFEHDIYRYIYVYILYKYNIYYIYIIIPKQNVEKKL